jgi:hypothetical protein
VCRGQIIVAQGPPLENCTDCDEQHTPFATGIFFRARPALCDGIGTASIEHDAPRPRESFGPQGHYFVASLASPGGAKRLRLTSKLQEVRRPTLGECREGLAYPGVPRTVRSGPGSAPPLLANPNAFVEAAVGAVRNPPTNNFINQPPDRVLSEFTSISRFPVRNSAVGNHCLTF